MTAADGAALIRAKQARSPKKFDDLVKHYRRQGFSDAEIVRAMVNSKLMINTGTLGGKR